MTIKTLDDIGYDEVREIGLHQHIRHAVKCRISFELAKRLESLCSDSERLQQVKEWELGSYKDSIGVYRESFGLVMNWDKIDDIYIPKRWKQHMQTRQKDGFLSHDEINLNPRSTEEQVFNETILHQKSMAQIYFFIYYSQWRRNVMLYARGRLDTIAQDLRGPKPGYKDDEITREYVSLITPLVERYKAEVAT